MRLHLVRHGRTPSNVRALLDTAVPGADLDAVGRVQADALVGRLADVPLEALYASDLVRTQQTLAPLAAARGLTPRVLGGLREIQAGSEEMSPDWRSYVGVLKAWGHGDLAARNPGGDDAASFFARYDEAVAEIAGAGHEHALLVSHGAALRVWLGARAAGLDSADTARRILGNTAIVTIEGGPGEWCFISWDDGVDTPGPDSDSLDDQARGTAGR